MKYHVSEFLGIEKGHSNIHFVDVDMNDDTKLFIDPSIIDMEIDELHGVASHCMHSYFDELYDAYREENRERQMALYAHCHEINSTRLGYGNGRNGKAKTPEGMYLALLGLSQLARQIPTITEPIDMVVLVQGFDRDCMSDLLTNLFHDILHQYTKMIMEQYDKPSNGRKTYYYWNSETRNWDSKTSEYWSYNGKEILLVPKTWLRFSFLCNAKQYLMMTIIEKIREDDSRGDLPKKVIYENLERETEHWVYDYVVQSSKNNPELLTQYHNDAKRHYLRKYGTMDDDELDKRVYQHSSENEKVFRNIHLFCFNYAVNYVTSYTSRLKISKISSILQDAMSKLNRI